MGFHSFSKYGIKFFYMSPLVLQKFSLSLKNYENFDANALSEAP